METKNRFAKRTPSEASLMGKLIDSKTSTADPVAAVYRISGDPDVCEGAQGGTPEGRTGLGDSVTSMITSMMVTVLIMVLLDKRRREDERIRGCK
ncbi:MAG: hypothetical protein LBE47_01720 [Methanomassiliicoccaceae archaeon]|jgi:hypothetical protein|nr:hypothetical protein [Methanomassiliicoccaceae archaeon]